MLRDNTPQLAVKAHDFYGTSIAAKLGIKIRYM